MPKTHKVTRAFTDDNGREWHVGERYSEQDQTKLSKALNEGKIAEDTTAPGSQNPQGGKPAGQQ